MRESRLLAPGSGAGSRNLHINNFVVRSMETGLVNKACPRLRDHVSSLNLRPWGNPCMYYLSIDVHLHERAKVASPCFHYLPTSSPISVSATRRCTSPRLTNTPSAPTCSSRRYFNYVLAPLKHENYSIYENTESDTIGHLEKCHCIQ